MTICSFSRKTKDPRQHSRPNQVTNNASTNMFAIISFASLGGHSNVLPNAVKFRKVSFSDSWFMNECRSEK